MDMRKSRWDMFTINQSDITRQEDCLAQGKVQVTLNRDDGLHVLERMPTNMIFRLMATLSPIALKNSKENGGNKLGDNERKTVRFRDFRVRQSLFTTLVENDNQVRFVAAIVAGFFWYHFMVMILFNRNQLRQDYAFVIWSLCENLHLFFLMWIQLFGIFLLSLLPSMMLMKRMISVYNFQIMVLSLILMTFFVLHYAPWSFKKEISPTLAFALYVEHMRILLKMIAFSVHSCQNVIFEKKAGHYEYQKGYSTDTVSFGHFIFYFFAPVVVYRDSYPLIPLHPINWRRIIDNLLHFIGTIYLLMVGLRHFIAPLFSKVCQQPLTPGDVTAMIITGYLYSFPVVVVGLGYAVFHCLQNITAELFHFGDRHFYGDWWRSSSSPEYLRKWNLLIGEWIFEYAFFPLMKITGSRFFSRTMVYSLSSLCHDYALYGLLGFFTPLHFMVYPAIATAGDIMDYLDRRLGLSNYVSKSHKITLFQFGFYIPFSLWVILSSTEYYARVHRPDLVDYSWIGALGLSPVFPRCVSLQ